MTSEFDPKQIRPLVSIVVLTYNSASTVQETLDSIAQQDYAPLEVIICDDASSDATLKILECWARANKNRFVDIKVLASSKNLGVCRNLARGYAAASGAWFKGIAGDDLLLPNAITKYMDSARTGQPALVVSLVQTFTTRNNGEHEYGTMLPSKQHLQAIECSGLRAQRQMALENPIPAPGVFLSRAAYEKVGGIDQEFMHLDDWPLWAKMRAHEMEFRTLHEPLVQYRVSPNSVSTKRLATTLNAFYLLDLVTFYRKYQRHLLPPLKRLDRFIEITRWKLASKALRNHPLLYKMTRLFFLFSPLRWSRIQGHGL